MVTCRAHLISARGSASHTAYLAYYLFFPQRAERSLFYGQLFTGFSLVDDGFPPSVKDSRSLQLSTKQ
jgi:hypothetical protein